MIVASGINVKMEGPMFLQYAEAGMILKDIKKKLIEENGEETGMILFKQLLELSLVDDEEMRKRDIENQKKLSDKENALLDKLADLICLTL